MLFGPAEEHEQGETLARALSKWTALTALALNEGRSMPRHQHARFCSEAGRAAWPLFLRPCAPFTDGVGEGQMKRGSCSCQRRASCCSACASRWT